MGGFKQHAADELAWGQAGRLRLREKATAFRQSRLWIQIAADIITNTSTINNNITEQIDQLIPNQYYTLSITHIYTLKNELVETGRFIPG